jgi:hypothetical protein
MVMSKLQPPDFYNPEEIQQILHLAIANSSEPRELSRQQLWEIAAELDIDRQLVQQAEKTWLDLQTINQKKQEFNIYRQRKLKNKAVRYLIVNVFLVSVNILSGGFFSWLYYLSLGWGLLLSLETWRTMQSSGDDYERDFQNWQLKNGVKRSLNGIWILLKKIYK